MARRRHRSAAQRAATRKLVAFNRARRRASNPVRRRRRVARRRNPVTKAAAYRTTATMTGRAANPIRRRRRRRHAASYMANPRRRRVHHRRRRRNPIGLPRGGKIMGMITPAATAALGAVLLDVIMGYASAYIPASLNTGPLKTVTKAAGAIGLSMLAGKVVSKSIAHAFGVGALTVVFYDLAKDLVHKMVPGVKMDGMGYYSAAYPAGGYMDGMGVYVGSQGTARSGLPNMGEYVQGMAGMNRFDSEHAYYNY